MKIGSLESPVLVENTWAVAYDSGELSSPQSSLTISGLSGDVDEEYRLIGRFICNNAAGVAYWIRLNNDSGANYGDQFFNGNNASVVATRITASVTSRLNYQVPNAQNAIQLTHSIIHAKSGYIRTILTKSAVNISGTTVGAVDLFGSVWNNTVDNLSSIVLTADNANGIGIGSRIILMKKVTSTSGMKTGSLEVQGKVYGVWQKVYEDTLGSAQTSVTISGLDGNTDVMYRITYRPVKSGTNTARLYPNNDTGTNYGYQFIRGVDATANAGRSTAEAGCWFGTGAINELNQNESIFYAKSGYVRTLLTEVSNSIAGTTVTSMMLFGFVWNNTADNITSLVIADSMAIGTFIKLEKLNL